MTLKEKQDALVQQINAVGDCFDQYTLLIVRSSDLPHMAEEEKTEDRRVKGCLSNVWLKISWPDGKLHLQADSDTLIIRGILSILLELVEGADPTELAQTELDFLQRTELSATFTSDRTVGMRKVIETLAGCACGLLADGADVVSTMSDRGQCVVRGA